ncbi:MAG: sialidase family protein [Spirochaetota bacterium]
MNSTKKYEALPLTNEVNLGGKTPISVATPPKPLLLRKDLGLLCAPAINGTVVYRAKGNGTLFETRATRTPGGDYLLMFPTNSLDGSFKERVSHYGGSKEKRNDLVAMRSSDKGRTWSEPTAAFDIDYNQHGFIPLIPKESKRIYAFGTQPDWGSFSVEHGQGENAPIGYRYSDDDGHHWSEVRLIRPKNDPDFRGMSVMRMCETDSGTWILGSHEGDWSYKPLMTRQYILRSDDKGKTWTVSPSPRHGGWCVPAFNRMDEGRPIALGGSKALILIRTCDGHLWEARSDDDGVTWSQPKPTSLVHPDAPPMLFHLTDGKTLIAFHHNRHYDVRYGGLTGENSGMHDRAELWFSLSTDEGKTWSEPRFVLMNAAKPDLETAWFNYQCSYADMFADDGVLNLFIPHRWQQVLHLTINESDLGKFPLRSEIE